MLEKFGMEPHSWFSLMSNDDRAEKVVKLFGIVPVKLFCDSPSSLMEVCVGRGGERKRERERHRQSIR